MRIPVRASLVLFVGLLAAESALPSARVAAQEVALAERGPRFLQLKRANQPPIEIDASSSGAMRLLVSLDLEEPTVGRILSAIERQTGLRFVYSRELVPPGRPVSLRAASITVAAALMEILLDANVDVLLSTGPQIALVARPPTATRDSGTVAGRVTDRERATPLAGATVLLERDARRSATTSSDGRFRFVDVPPGAYTVRARYIGYTPISGTVTVTSGAEVVLDLALAKSTQRLNEVVVTGTVIPTEVKALPTPISVITSSDIETQRPRTTSQLLRQVVPGSLAWDQPSDPMVSKLTTRGAATLGTGSATTKIYIDGIEIAKRGFAAVDPRSIERIELIRGPQASTIYGSDAIGGVMQIFTKRGDSTATRPEIEASAGVGSVQSPYAGSGAVRQAYALSVRGAGPGFRYNLGGDITDIGNWKPEGAQTVPNLFGGVRVNQGKFTLDVSGRYSAPRSGPSLNPDLVNTGFFFFSQPFYLDARASAQTLGSRVTYQPSATWRHNLAAGVDIVGTEQISTRPRLTTPADTFLQVSTFNDKKVSVGYNTSVSGRISSNISLDATAGIDHYRYTSESNFTGGALNTTGGIRSPGGPISLSRNTVTNTGFFGQVQLGYQSKLFVTAGLRGEDNSTFGTDLGTPVSPRFGAAYTADFGTGSLKIRGSYGEGIQPPSPGLGQASATALIVVLANPLLGPERQTGWDAGIDLSLGGGISFSATYYRQIAEDLIQQVTVDATASPQITQFQNVARVRNEGAEFEGSWDFGFARLHGQFAVTTSRVEDLGPTYTGNLLVGDQVLGIPKYSGGISATIIPAASTTVTGGLTYVGERQQFNPYALFACFGGTGPCQPTQRDYITTYAGFIKFNVSLTQRFTPWLSGFAWVENVGNNAVVEEATTIPVMGRVMMIGVEARY